MKADTLNLDTLAGLAGQIGVVIEPKPCRGPLSYRIVTHPAALHVRALGIDLRPAGAHTQGNQLLCRFKTKDVGRALPALIAYFEVLELAVFCKYGYRLPDQSPAQLEPWRDIDAARSYVQATDWTWRDRFRNRWQKVRNSGRGLRLRAWWCNRRMLGDVSRACVAVASAAGAVAWLGYFNDRLMITVSGVAISGLAFAGALLTRPVLPREAVERLIEADAAELLQSREDFKRQMAEMKPATLPDDDHDVQGGPTK